jgi:hypothetical protein
VNGANRADVFSQRLLIGAGAGVLLCAIAALVDLSNGLTQFLHSYLFAYLICLGIVLGCLAILLIPYTTGGIWGFAVRGVAESALSTLPWLAVMFLPIALGVEKIYPWADKHLVEGDPLLQHKRPYLNVTFFIVRAAIYFVIWIGIAYILRSGSKAQARSYDPARARRLQLFAGPSLGIYGLTITFAAIDWIMSLEPKWFSSIFGALIGVGWLLPGMAFVIVALAVLDRHESDKPAPSHITKNLWNDLGTLLLMCVMLWAYMSFAQLLLIWSGNLPEEISWYLARIAGGWRYLAWILFLFYFAAPFLMLLSRDVKSDPTRLSRLAIGILVVHCVYHYWLIRPAFRAHELHGAHDAPAGFDLHWIDLVVLFGVVAVWGVLVTRALRTQPLFPEYEPEWKEYLAHGESHGHESAATSAPQA